jgi:hypothetical protein
MESRQLQDTQNDTKVLLLTRIRNSGLGQTFAWCRANTESAEAKLCAATLAGFADLAPGIEEDPIALLQRGGSLQLLELTARFEALLRRDLQGLQHA